MGVVVFAGLGVCPHAVLEELSPAGIPLPFPSVLLSHWHCPNCLHECCHCRFRELFLTCIPLFPPRFPESWASVACSALLTPLWVLLTLAQVTTLVTGVLCLCPVYPGVLCPELTFSGLSCDVLTLCSEAVVVDLSWNSTAVERTDRPWTIRGKVYRKQ